MVKYQKDNLQPLLKEGDLVLIEHGIHLWQNVHDNGIHGDGRRSFDTLINRWASVISQHPEDQDWFQVVLFTPCEMWDRDPHTYGPVTYLQAMTGWLYLDMKRFEEGLFQVFTEGDEAWMPQTDYPEEE